MSRTGYTGDLGFEVTVPRDQALDVLDAILEAGTAYGLRPFGEDALMMLRIEAGLPLIDVDFQQQPAGLHRPRPGHPAGARPRLDAQGRLDGDRPFIGRDAIVAELRDGTSRWSTVGIVADWQDWDRLYRDAGLLPEKNEQPARLGVGAVRRRGRARSATPRRSCTPPCSSATSAWPGSSPEYAEVGSEVHLETTINHHNTTVLARTARMPLFNPERKTSTP